MSSCENPCPEVRYPLNYPYGNERTFDGAIMAMTESETLITQEMYDDADLDTSNPYLFFSDNQLPVSE